MSTAEWVGIVIDYMLHYHVLAMRHLSMINETCWWIYSVLYWKMWNKKHKNPVFTSIFEFSRNSACNDIAQIFYLNSNSGVYGDLQVL